MRAPVAVRALGLACLACGSSAPGRAPDLPDPGAGFPGRWPEVVAVGERVGFVPTADDDSVWVVREDGDTARVPVGRDPVLSDGPQTVVVDEARGLVYVLLATPGSLPGGHPHGPAERPGWVRKLSMRDLRPLGEAAVDPAPGEIALSADGETLVATELALHALAAPGGDDARRARISIVSTRTMSLVAPVEPEKRLVCAAPRGVAISRDGKTAYVACYGEDALAIADLTGSGSPVLRVALGKEIASPGDARLLPNSVSLRADGSEVVIAASFARAAIVVDLAGRKVAAELRVKGLARDAIWIGDRVLVAVQEPDALVLIDRRTGAIVRERSVADDLCVGPTGLAPFGADVLLTCEAARALVIDPATLATRRPVGVGVGGGRPASGIRR